MWRVPKEVGLVPVLVYVLLAVLGPLLDPSGESVFDPPYLLTFLNVIFLTGTGLAIAVLSASGYLRHGSVNVLLLGCAVMASGLAPLISGYSSNFISANSGVTVHNINFLLSSILQFLSAMVTIRMVDRTIEPQRPRMLTISYALVALFVATITALTYAGVVPTFLSGTGPTPLRQSVLALTLLFFLLSSVMLYAQHFRLRSKALFWYSLGLTMFAIGMASLLFQTTNGDLSSWIGRIAQYSGGFYFLLAVLSLKGTTNVRADMSERWSEAFMNDQQESANFFSNMLNAFVYGRVEASREGGSDDMLILDSNRAFERVSGTERQAVLGRRLSELVPGLRDNPPPWLTQISLVAREGTSFQTETYVEPLRKWLNISAYSPREGYFVAIFEDVTERWRMEGALRESEERYRRLIKYAPTAIFEIDLEGDRFRTVNDAMCALTEYSREELLAMDPLDLLTPEGRELFRSRTERLRSGEVIEETVEHEVLIKGGRRLSMVMQVMPLYEDGRPTGEFVIAHDITKRKKMEEELRLSNQELQQFAYVASHDLQEPLRTVSLYASLMEKHGGELSVETKEYVQIISEATARMRRMVSDLQQYTRVEVKNRPFAPTDLNLVLSGVLDDLRSTIEESGAVVLTDPLPTVWADRGQMSRVLLNLISNAIKFHGPDAPRVHVYATQSPLEWTVAVQDNGIGIESRYANKLFVLFQRLHSQAEYEGTGIGLAICKKIVERHGGRIWLESDGRSGTTFLFTLPSLPPRPGRRAGPHWT